ncbi:hypothetical protein D9758_008803 [Tetrapyrgos nigripes]|uniref:Uncharacterized protein n=1 Tax=Tetrapyrgos nigripes TaxID=182062 RepID=A0A8H5D5K7_9AGAR|nr:hypothetical protein D9758_008803 [Tetrapyrgos nigripes]
MSPLSTRCLNTSPPSIHTALTSESYTSRQVDYKDSWYNSQRRGLEKLLVIQWEGMDICCALPKALAGPLWAHILKEKMTYWISEMPKLYC